MNTVISPAEIQRAKDAVSAALLAAYGPMQVKEEQLCWEGRIANAVEKAPALIATGDFTDKQIREVITEFEKSLKAAETTARTAQDTYFTLCKQAGITPQVFKRPPCPCRFCKERIQFEAAEEYKRSILRVVETRFEDNDALKLAKEFAQLCQQRGITVALDLI